MKPTLIDLPESAKEFLATCEGVAMVFPVMMRDRRLLKLSYSLMPQYCGEVQVPEDAEFCPNCGLKLS